MNDAERAQAKRRVAAFKQRNPGFLETVPPVIIGVGDREICLLDATYADFKHYQRFLERRIDRQKRLRRIA